MNKNKTGKYLMYSIGEIILVVIGILIALSINNWNEKRKQKLVEIEILSGLKKDILMDTIDINDNIRGYKRIIKNDSILFDHFAKTNTKNKEIGYRLLYYTFGEYSLSLHHSHFDEVKQKGLSIISNTTLRDSISHLYEYEYSLLEEVDKLGQFTAYNKIISDKVSSGFSINLKEQYRFDDEFYDKLLLDRNFLYLLMMHKRREEQKLSIYSRNLKYALEISEAIDKELIKLNQK